MEQLRSFEKTAFAFEQENLEGVIDRNSCMVSGHSHSDVRMHRVSTM